MSARARTATRLRMSLLKMRAVKTHYGIRRQCAPVESRPLHAANPFRPTRRGSPWIPNKNRPVWRPPHALRSDFGPEDLGGDGLHSSVSRWPESTIPIPPRTVPPGPERPSSLETVFARALGFAAAIPVRGFYQARQ